MKTTERAALNDDRHRIGRLILLLEDTGLPYKFVQRVKDTSKDGRAVNVPIGGGVRLALTPKFYMVITSEDREVFKHRGVEFVYKDVEGYLGTLTSEQDKNVKELIKLYQIANDLRRKLEFENLDEVKASKIEKKYNL